MVLIGAVPPLMLKTPANPDGLPMAVFDDTRKGTAANRSTFFRELATLRTNLPMFERVDQLRWQGPTPVFAELGARFDRAARGAKL